MRAKPNLMNKKNVLILFLRQLLVLTLLLAATGAARAETAETGAAQAVVRDFFEYLLSKGANIGNDAKAQERWLTRDMRALLLESTQAVVEAR